MALCMYSLHFVDGDKGIVAMYWIPFDFHVLWFNNNCNVNQSLFLYALLCLSARVFVLMLFGGDFRCNWFADKCLCLDRYAVAILMKTAVYHCLVQFDVI